MVLVVQEIIFEETALGQLTVQIMAIVLIVQEQVLILIVLTVLERILGLIVLEQLQVVAVLRIVKAVKWELLALL